MKKQQILDYLKRKKGVDGALAARRISDSREFRFHPDDTDITTETVQKWIEATGGLRPETERKQIGSITQKKIKAKE